MQNNDSALPRVEKISILISALKGYACQSVRAHEDDLTDIFDAPCLALWDAVAWFELVQDGELADFLVSNKTEAKLLVKTFQSCLQLYWQIEIDDIRRRMSIMRIIN